MTWTVEWWTYTLMALTVFFSCILLNYIVNKINEAQLEERLLILHLKNPAGRVTQAQEPLGMETEKPGRSLTGTKSNTILEIKIQEIKPTEILFSSEVKNGTPVYLSSIYRAPKGPHGSQVGKITEVIELTDFNKTAKISEETDESKDSGSRKENNQIMLSTETSIIDNDAKNFEVKTLSQSAVLSELPMSNSDCVLQAKLEQANKNILPEEDKKINDKNVI